MKKSLLFLALTLLATGLFAQGNSPAKTQKKAPTVVLKNNLDSASYAYGIAIATSVKRQLTDDMNPDMLIAALTAALKGDSVLFTPEAAQACFADYNKMAQAKASEKSKKEGLLFLENNKKRKEVTTTASGLQYEVLKHGTATQSPKATDKVEVHYHGTLLDGSVFDSSVERGQTSSFGLNQVIKGWTEGLQLMHVGDKFRFVIPADLAYGDRSPSPKIKPGSTLIFEVELFKILPN